MQLERSGGFAGLLQQWVLDTADLPPEAGRELERLVEAAEGAPKPGPPDPRLRDAFQYDLTIQRDGQTRRLSFGDTTVPPEVRPLLERIQAEGRRG